MPAARRIGVKIVRYPRKADEHEAFAIAMNKVRPTGVVTKVDEHLFEHRPSSLQKTRIYS